MTKFVKIDEIRGSGDADLGSDLLWFWNLFWETILMPFDDSWGQSRGRPWEQFEEKALPKHKMDGASDSHRLPLTSCRE